MNSGFTLTEGANMHDLGSRIRQLRKQRRMTQQQLSEGICTKSFVSQVEKGHARPALDTLQAFADRLGVGLADLFEPGERTTPPAWVAEALRDIVQALEATEHTRALHRALMTLGQIYEMTGDRDGALEAYCEAAGIATGTVSPGVSTPAHVAAPRKDWKAVDRSHPYDGQFSEW